MRHRNSFRKISKQRNIRETIKAYLIVGVLIVILFLILNSIFQIKIIKTKVSKKQVIIKDIKRSEVYKRGMDIINYTWEYNPNKNGVIDTEEIKLPGFLKNSGNNIIKVKGLPYCWGGYLSLDNSDISDIKNFQDAINKGYIAGNVNCVGNYKKYTAGLDCSGFVCAVFNISEKLYTANLNIYFDKINLQELKPMDILNSEKNHVFVFIKESNDKKGVITMESAVNKYSENSGKTIINYRSWESINKGINGEPYIPMRYKGIIDDEGILKLVNTVHSKKDQGYL